MNDDSIKKLVQNRIKGVDPVLIEELGLSIHFIQPDALTLLDFIGTGEAMKKTPEQESITIKDLDSVQRRVWIQQMFDLVQACSFLADGSRAFPEPESIAFIPFRCLERMVNLIPLSQGDGQS